MGGWRLGRPVRLQSGGLRSQICRTGVLRSQIGRMGILRSDLATFHSATFIRTLGAALALFHTAFFGGSLPLPLPPTERRLSYD